MAVTTFETGTTFVVIDKASAVIAKIGKAVADLDKQIASAQANLAKLGDFKFATVNAEVDKLSKQFAALSDTADAAITGMTSATDAAAASARALAAEWMNVTRAARGANAAAATAGGAGRGGRGGGVGGVTVAGPAGFALPGGGHIGLRRDAGMAAAGLVGYGIYQESVLEDAAARAVFTDNGAKDSADFARREKAFRDAVANVARKTGMPIHGLAEAGLSEVRQLAGLSWDQKIGMLPEVLEYASAEARLKGTSVEEAASSLIGLAHQTKTYDPAGMANLFSKFGYLSTIVDLPLDQMVRQFGYSVPVLQGSGIDPFQDMLLQSVMSRAGLRNKSGTWLRELAIRAFPGTSLVSKTAFKKHEKALAELGLVDASGKPTWFTNGAPDMLKMLQIASQHVNTIPVTERASLERQLFGAQGSGALAVLSDPKIQSMIPDLVDAMNKFRSGVDFFKSYAEHSPTQAARQTWGDLRGILVDIGQNVLPPLVRGLQNFDAALKGSVRELAPILGGAFAGFRVAGVPGAVAGAAAGAVLPAPATVDKEHGQTWSQWWENIKANPWGLFGLGDAKTSVKEGAEQGTRQGVTDALKGNPATNPAGSAAGDNAKKTQENTGAVNENTKQLQKLNDNITGASPINYTGGAMLQPAVYESTGGGFVTRDGVTVPADSGAGPVGKSGHKTPTGGFAIPPDLLAASGDQHAGINRDWQRKQLLSNPALLESLFRHSVGENSNVLANQAVMEEAANRAQVRGMIHGGKMGMGLYGNLSYFQGYYRGNLKPYLPMLWDNFNKVFVNGSDISKGAIDNSSSWLSWKHEHKDHRFRTLANFGGDRVTGHKGVESLEAPWLGESMAGERAMWDIMRRTQLAQMASHHHFTLGEIHDAVTGVGQPSGDGPHVEWGSPGSHEHDEPSSASPAIAPHGGGQPIIIHTNLQLDGRVVAKNTLKHIAKEGNLPARGSRLPDYWITRPITV